MDAAWPRCLERLEAELPAEEVHTWLRPLQAEAHADGRKILARRRAKGRARLAV